MTYTPKSEEQLIKEGFGLLPEGVYDFEIFETSDAPSRKGNEMFMFKLCIFDSEGTQRHIFDYIVFGTNFGERKLRRAAASCGLIDIYNSGDLKDTTFLNATGKALIKQQNGTAEYPAPRNIVSEYLPRSDTVEHIITKPAKEIINDDIPF